MLDVLVLKLRRLLVMSVLAFAGGAVADPLTPNDVSISDVSFTRVQDRDRTMLFVQATVTNTTPYVISGLLARAYVWGARPAALAQMRFADLGDVISGGMLPGESLIVSGDIRLSDRANGFIEDASKLRLVLDIRDIIDETGHSMMCTQGQAPYARSLGPSPKLCVVD